MRHLRAVNEASDEGAKRILLIDDDVELAALLGEYLESEGFVVDAVANGVQGIARALEGGHDVVVLDIMMPGLSGIDVLRRLRETSEVPVLMLTARGDEIDRVIGLELGADDYVAKPCFPRELVARLRAILRRQRPLPGQTFAATPTLRAGALEIQVPERRALWQGRALELTPTEFNILVLLVRGGEAVATKDELSLRGLGRARQSYDRSIDVHVSNLRLKLEAGSGGAAGIETVRGVGYRLNLS
ncbi:MULTISPECIES: response regulator transcription factor [Novosphingobium]|uniref:Response regulator transcription factor n=1 Tax=Novosphingobium decolorationis TaxID=2698673 RepID=A0ABX8E408_9SPHN|nr:MULTISPECIES: response regulator transcription factor [Novosphingobium]MBT0668327.1 response regulator transcription factor [Novosphingobium profundi]QVM83729.1 response regulator transcription factor [Novosphingobium decolorationis]